MVLEVKITLGNIYVKMESEESYSRLSEAPVSFR